MEDIPPAIDFEGTPAYPAEYTSSMTVELLYPEEIIDLSVAEKYYIQINETTEESDTKKEDDTNLEESPIIVSTSVNDVG